MIDETEWREQRPHDQHVTEDVRLEVYFDAEDEAASHPVWDDPEKRIVAESTEVTFFDPECDDEEVATKWITADKHALVPIGEPPQEVNQ